MAGWGDSKVDTNRNQVKRQESQVLEQFPSVRKTKSPAGRIMAPKAGHVLIPGTHNDLKSEREGELRRVLKI